MKHDLQLPVSIWNLLPVWYYRNKGEVENIYTIKHCLTSSLTSLGRHLLSKGIPTHRYLRCLQTEGIQAHNSWHTYNDRLAHIPSACELKASTSIGERSASSLFLRLSSNFFLS